MSRRPIAVALILLGVVVIGFGAVLAAKRGTSTASGAVVPIVNLGADRPGSSARTTAAASRNGVRGPTTVPSGSRVALTRLGLSALIAPVTTTGSVMNVPRDPRTVGWWTGGAAPGRGRGSVVLVGHVNYAGVAGALSVLPRLRLADRVSVTENSRVFAYAVTKVRSYAKTTGLPPAVFDQSGPERLVLITCGGPFDPVSGNYEDNIVAWAEPTG